MNMFSRRSFDYYCASGVPSRVNRKDGVSKYRDYDDIALSEIKILSLPANYERTLHRLETTDAVLRDLVLNIPKEEITEHIIQAEQPEPTQTIQDTTCNEKASPKTPESAYENAVGRKSIRHRTRHATTFTYEGDPDIMLRTIENFIKLNGAQHLKGQPLSATIDGSRRSSTTTNACHHCTGKEIIQTQKLMQLSMWRKTFMGEVEKKLGADS